MGTPHAHWLTGTLSVTLPPCAAAAQIDTPMSIEVDGKQLAFTSFFAMKAGK